MELPTQKIVEILRTVDLCAKTNMTMENSSMNEDIFPIENGGFFHCHDSFCGMFFVFCRHWVPPTGSTGLLSWWPTAERWQVQDVGTLQCSLGYLQNVLWCWERPAGRFASQVNIHAPMDTKTTPIISFLTYKEILRYILKWLLNSICELFGEGVTDPIVTYLNKAFESVAGHCDSCGGKGKGDESTGESGTSQVSPSGSWTAACFWCWKSYFSMCSRLVARVRGKQHVIECSYLHQNMMMRYNTIENKIYIYVYVLNMGD